MSTLGALYRMAREIYREKQAEAMRSERPSYQLLREIDELKRMMDGLLQAYKDAGGGKAT